MVDPNVLKKLQKALRNQALLYVESNPGLRAQAGEFFQSVFETVHIAADGEEGLALFRKHHPPIVVTAIKMPKIDGLNLIRTIQSEIPETKIIITSAHDDPAWLHEAIRLKVFDYLVKPVTMQKVVETLIRCAKELRIEMHQRLFNTYLHQIFNYQHNLILLLHQETVVMANQPCLEFFKASGVEEFQRRFLNFGELLLEHSGFLYNRDKIEWLREAKNHPGKLYNVKIADGSGQSHHFVLNLQTLPDKDDYYVLSLNDVTELNLLRLFDPTAVDRESIVRDQKALRGLLEMAKRNNAKIKLHNLYKGLSIANDGIIDELAEKFVRIKTTQMQLKAIQLERQVVLVSDIFPMFIVSTDILSIDMERLSVKLGECKMTSTSPTRREYIRVIPEKDARVTMLYQGRKFDTNLEIGDVSIKALRLVMDSLPAGFQVGSKVILDLVLGVPPLKLTIINTPADVLRIREQSRYFEVVFTYDLASLHRKELTEYIAKRQMQLIREFKERTNG